MPSGEVVGYLLGGGARPLAIYAGDVITIGRDPQNTLCIADVLSSRNHAVVECPAQHEVFLRDLGSTNGTFLNNERLSAQRRMRLHTGDSIRIGGKLLSFTGLESQEQKTFGNRVTRMDTVRDGLFYRDGKVVEIPADSAQSNDERFKNVLETQVVQPLPQNEPALAGSLSDQNLAQIIQYLHTNSKTGELLVRGKNREGLIAFDHGLIVSAQSGDRNGVVAIYAVARERSGSFSFKAVENVGVRPKNVNEPVMQIIFECCKRMDETELAGL
jgi:hypothetical protein